MSWSPGAEPNCPEGTQDAVETLIVPRARDLGGFEVMRVLPSGKRQMVGPFIFFDQAGPAAFAAGKGIDVRPHPHIGLATVTYLYEGHFHHRDSLGSDQVIWPGEVNWMIAGRGVTHSERTGTEARKQANRLFGIQTWVALPRDREDDDPSFEHHGKDALPYLENEGARLRLILGSAYGETAPARVFSEMFYADVELDPGATLPLPEEHEDRGVYVATGSVSIAATAYEAGRMVVVKPGLALSATAGESGARLMLLGGEVMDGPRHIWWNFVASSRERIEAAKRAWAEEDWANGPFRLPPGDDEEHIPLPR